MTRSHAVLFKQRAICLWYTHVLVFIQLVIIAARQSNGSYKLHTLLLHPLSQICAVFVLAAQMVKAAEDSGSKAYNFHFNV